MLFFFFQSLCSDTDIIAFSLLSHILRAKDHRRITEGKSASWRSRVCDEGKSASWRSRVCDEGKTMFLLYI